MTSRFVPPPVHAVQWLGHEPGHPLVARIPDDDEQMGDWPEERRALFGICASAEPIRIVRAGSWIVIDHEGRVRIYPDHWFRYLFRPYDGEGWP